MRSKCAVLITAFLISSCAKPGESICKESIKETLLNPETAKFYDYSIVSLEDKLSSVPVTRSNDGSISGQFKDVITNGNLKYSKVRVRADGQLGNKVTSTMSCQFDNKSCSCTDDGING